MVERKECERLGLRVKKRKNGENHDSSRQVVWIHTLMGELGYHLKPIPICGDNQGSIFIASNPVTEKRSKHIDIRYHYIREVITRRIADVFFIDGDENPADLLTKDLGSVKFQKFRAMLGLEFLTHKRITAAKQA